MKSKIFLVLFALLIVIGCKQEKKNDTSEWVKISDRVQYRQDAGVLELQSGKFSYKIPETKLPFKKIMLLNASLTGYILELNAENVIQGMASPEYVYSGKIQQRIAENKIQRIGNDQKYDIEKIIAFKPEAIFTNYIESFENTYDILRKNGIELIFIDEYMEQNPLEKARIIELFGTLLGKKELAEKRYAEIAKDYQSMKELVSKQKDKPVVLANEMYGNQWFLPGGKTYVAHYFSDAGASYILKDSKDEVSVPMSFEEVFVKAEMAQYWVNVSDHKSRRDLLTINPNYAKMNVYQKGKIYSMAGAVRGNANDAFESGAVRADIVLKDYIRIFHPNIFPNYKLTYLKEIE